MTSKTLRRHWWCPRWQDTNAISTWGIKWGEGWPAISSISHQHCFNIHQQHHLVWAPRQGVAFQDSTSRGNNLANGYRHETQPQPDRHGERNLGKSQGGSGGQAGTALALFFLCVSLTNVSPRVNKKVCPQLCEIMDWSLDGRLEALCLQFRYLLLGA